MNKIMYCVAFHVSLIMWNIFSIFMYTAVWTSTSFFVMYVQYSTVYSHGISLIHLIVGGIGLFPFGG